MNECRWGGLGNHRYPIGFSGDVKPSWASLDFEVTSYGCKAACSIATWWIQTFTYMHECVQVSFTASASNVLYGYWSHDIGGHTEKPSAELYTRYVD
jgi:alpha-glucosidase (family GH31 glycosyl hydrolase)